MKQILTPSLKEPSRIIATITVKATALLKDGKVFIEYGGKQKKKTEINARKNE
jgi:hypothetical protein